MMKVLYAVVVALVWATFVVGSSPNCVSRSRWTVWQPAAISHAVQPGSPDCVDGSKTWKTSRFCAISLEYRAVSMAVAVAQRPKMFVWTQISLQCVILLNTANTPSSRRSRFGDAKPEIPVQPATVSTGRDYHGWHAATRRMVTGRYPSPRRCQNPASWRHRKYLIVINQMLAF